VLWSDPSLGIDWGVGEPIVSEKDMLLPTLPEFVAANQGGL
jgi:dTDP-4-dehydrorhamnose 3,5-epimerase